MRETPQERRYREERYASRSTATRPRRRRRRRRNSGTAIILILFCALLAGGAVGTWKMARSTAAAQPPASGKTDDAAEPPVQADPVQSSTDAREPDNTPSQGQEPGQTVPVGATGAQPPTVPEADPEPDEAFQMDPLPDDLEEKVQKVLADIITPDMTRLEQAKAVWDFTKNGIRYTGDSDKSSWEEGAREGLDTRKGDCFTYYAVSRAMLTSLGIPNIEVTRVGGISSHYWNLVNCGDGWYHFDATPRSSKLPSFVSFMFTDQEAADYTVSVGGGREYYTFDGSLYPERATEKPWEAAELPHP